MSRATPELAFVALGGAGEIGMNLNLYGYGRPPEGHQWLMVDLGVTFGDGSIPGVDVITPDPAFIVQRRDRLLGLVLTHAHEDHLGAVPYLWQRLGCPISATPFTVSILTRKLREAGLTAKCRSTPFWAARHDRPARSNHGHPFDPEPNALAIRTPPAPSFTPATGN